MNTREEQERAIALYGEAVARSLHDEALTYMCARGHGLRSSHPLDSHETLVTPNAGRAEPANALERST